MILATNEASPLGSTDGAGHHVTRFGTLSKILIAAAAAALLSAAPAWAAGPVTGSGWGVSDSANGAFQIAYQNALSVLYAACPYGTVTNIGQTYGNTFFNYGWRSTVTLQGNCTN